MNKGPPPSQILQIKTKLIELIRKKIKIQLLWIPVHVGIQGNQNADDLAKKGAMAASLTNFDIPFTDLTGMFKTKINNRNIEKLKEMSLPKGTFCFENFFKESIKRWYDSFNVNRRVILITNCIRSVIVENRRRL